MNKANIFAAALLIGCCDVNEPPVLQLDQENLFTGGITSTLVGTFAQPGGGVSGDHQVAQTFTVEGSGRLARVRTPLRSAQGWPAPPAGATMTIVAVDEHGLPDDGHTLVEASISTTALLPPFDNLLDFEKWQIADFTSSNIQVMRGQQLAFVIRSTNAFPIDVPVEHNSGYVRGAAFLRDKTLSNEWALETYDHLFQVFIIPE